MPNLDQITNSHLILSANRAMLCLIHSNMREINIEYSKINKKIILHVFFDTEPTDDQIDDVGSISTEMSCQYPEEIKWEENIVCIPYPYRIPSRGICVYRRYEPSPDVNE